MELHQIKARLDRIRDTLLRGGKFDIDWAVEVLSAAREYLDDAEDAPPVDGDDGFAILPMARYEALREAEEHLQETRFEPANREDDPDPNSLSRRFDRQYELIRDAQRVIRERDQEIARLREEAKVRAEAAAPLEPEPPRVPHEVFLAHLRDLQGEIDGIKDRLDEGCGEFNESKARSDAHAQAVGETLSTIFDRLGGMTAWINKLEAKFAGRLDKLEADVMPIRRMMVREVEKAVEAKRADAREGAPS